MSLYLIFLSNGDLLVAVRDPLVTVSQLVGCVRVPHTGVWGPCLGYRAGEPPPLVELRSGVVEVNAKIVWHSMVKIPLFRRFG